MVLQLEPDICMHRKPLQHYQGWGQLHSKLIKLQELA